MGELEDLTQRLKDLAAAIDGEEDTARAAELVTEASKLAAEAGEAAEVAVREASSPPAEG